MNSSSFKPIVSINSSEKIYSPVYCPLTPRQTRSPAILCYYNMTHICPLEKANWDCSYISQESLCVTGYMWVISIYPTAASRVPETQKELKCLLHSKIIYFSKQSILNLSALQKHDLFYSINKYLLSTLIFTRYILYVIIFIIFCNLPQILKSLLFYLLFCEWGPKPASQVTWQCAQYFFL